eukprot:Em0013g1053a
MVVVAAVQATNTTNCSAVLDGDATGILAASVVISGVSIAIAVIPSIVVFYLRLHRQFTYRVAFYQVLGAILYHCAGILATLFPLAIDHNKKHFVPVCQFAAFSLTFFFWVKLFFVSFIVVHLFIYAVIYRSIKRFEPAYIVSSIICSLVIATVPFMTKTYGLAGPWCWIENRQDDCSSQVLLDGVIEQFALYYVPGLACLAVDSVLAAAMVTILYLRAQREKKRDPTIKRQPLQEAIKQMLPLVAYPMLFLLLLLPGFANRVYGATPNQPSVGLTYFSTVSIALWGFVGGAALSLHIMIMRYSQRAAKHKTNAAISYGTAEAVVMSSRPAACTSGTHFVLPSESDFDECK